MLKFRDKYHIMSPSLSVLRSILVLVLLTIATTSTQAQEEECFDKKTKKFKVPEQDDIGRTCNDWATVKELCLNNKVAANCVKICNLCHCVDGMKRNKFKVP